MTKLKQLFENHLRRRIEVASTALNSLNYNSLILGSGEPFTYFQDDNNAIFKTNPHFAHWCPAKGPHHFIKFEPTKKPMLVYYSPKDFWHSHEELNDSFWGEFFDVVLVHEKEQLWSSLGDLTHSVFLGNEIKYAQASGVTINCQLLTARLNWHRRFKSEYEVHCLSEANKLASKAHLAAKESFLNGNSEFEIHMNYLQALQGLDEQLPYSTIVGLNKNAAVLHYHKKEFEKNGDVLLIDAGASYNHYGSDITRTYTSSKCNSLFKDLCDATIQMQKELVSEVKPNLSYPHLHEKCHLKIAEILNKLGIINIGSRFEEAVENGITKAFFPHGLGHMLGIQVHDIGGKQIDEQGNIAPLNSSKTNYRSLRFVGTLEEGNVVTVEPGIYFIPMLLNKLKADENTSKSVNWNVVDELIPLGGIRIEDDILVTQDGFRNLTREFLN